MEEEISDLCFEYNNLKPSLIKERDKLLRRIAGKVGANVSVKSPFWCEYGSNIVFGDNFNSDYNLIINASSNIVFGSNVFVGPNCSFCSSSLPLEFEERNNQIKDSKPIIVGNNVSFGCNVVVKGGVTIGDNVVIEESSVVSISIPSNSYASGNPCKVIKKLPLDGHIEQMI